MQITKSTEQKVEKAMIPFTEQVKEFPQKVGNFFTKNKRKTMIITASVLIICAAVGVNWLLFGPVGNAATPEGTGDPAGAVSPDASTPVDASGEIEAKDFFAIAITDRQKARDEALEVYEMCLANGEASSADKQEASSAIARIASYIEAEGNIETLVKSKGFSHCVAVVSEDNVTVIVGTEDTLMANELAQIKEIIYLQTGVDPTGMRITEKIITNAE